MSLDNAIKAALCTESLRCFGRSGGGCINEGQGYVTDHGKVFIKKNADSKAKVMFVGEFEGLKALYATNTIRVPKPVKVLDNPEGGACFAAEYIEMSGLSSSFAAELGRRLARMHLHNAELLKNASERASWLKPCHDEDWELQPVTKFGFHCTTCCGYIPLDNSWTDSWVEFFTQKRLQAQIDLLQSKNRNSELESLWVELQRKLPKFFAPVEPITPALLHGDLWTGNAAQTADEPVIFDPASFYGHSEFEMGIATMFGGFPKTFYKAYHELIPKAPGFDERLLIYQLFNYLNHWNHFGHSYSGSSLSLMRMLIKM